ncbi:methyltransferase Fsa4 [Penicillium citrinum]|uniref:Methyltransferase Fsa4 n=1 Tax=Penicillium citrinum TaxID=5077 RepID=A0A9W9NXA0_PENCI|nr:methyltransferase Fsa4 [Penicillium citrinum]KAJ5231499.1 methyltransferase Fsa4 [Penicillium citrinum]
MIELGVLRFFIEYGVFNAISESSKPISQLATETGVDPRLLGRQVNFLIAAGVLSSPTPGHVEHTPLSKKFQEPLATLFYPHLFDSFMTTAVKWTEYFRLNGAKEPQSSDGAPFGFAMGHPNKTFYEVLELMPERAKSFNKAMALSLDDMPVTGFYDFGEAVSHAIAQAGGLEGPCIVDVGGGKGQALKAILETYPLIPASCCALEDQADVIKQASEEASGVMLPVQRIVHNIFEEQPVKGN